MTTSPELWPSNQDEWDALAKKIQDKRVNSIIAQLPHLDDEPLSPEEEEALF